MAQQYVLTTDSFVAITETNGTIQNAGIEAVELVSGTNAVAGEGITLRPDERIAFDGAISARRLGDNDAIINVVDFSLAGKGGVNHVYIPKGSVAFASLPTTLTEDMLGWTYNVSDAFTTDSQFVDGAGISYPAGQNVVVVEASTGVYKYDCFAGAYILPVATEVVLGGVKSSTVSGGVSVDSLGVMTINMPVASESVLGGVKVGNGLSMDTDTLVLQTASESVKGGVIIGAGLSMNSDTLTLNVGDGLSMNSDTLVLETASESMIGGIKSTTVAGGVSVDSLGNPTINLPTASESVKGGIKIGDSFDIDNDVLILEPAKETVVGGIKSSTIAGGVSVDSVGNATINLPIASDSVLGGVKSSTIAGGVSVDSLGNMSVSNPVSTAYNLANENVLSLTKGVLPSNFTWYREWRKSDKDGKLMANISFAISDNGESSVALMARDFAPGSSTIALLNVVQGYDGGESYASCPTPASRSDRSSKIATTAWVHDVVGRWLPSTSYAVGDVVYTPAFTLKSCKKLVCVKAGTSGSTLTLSSTDDGAYITDGTAAWVIDSLADGNYSAGHGNGIYRGVDVTAYWESGDMSANIQAGKFVGFHIGDYIVKSVTTAATTYTDKSGNSQTQAEATYSNVKWLVAGLDLLWQIGETPLTTHHVFLIPSETLQINVAMNPTNTTEGGYVGSDVWRVHMPIWATAIKTAFGATHVLSHTELLSNAINVGVVSGGYPNWMGAASGFLWTNVDVNIPNETMIYGSCVFSSSGADIADMYMQLPLFTLKGSLLFGNTAWMWLRSVASSSIFTAATRYGAYYFEASHAINTGGIRPYFLLK